MDRDPVVGDLVQHINPIRRDVRGVVLEVDECGQAKVEGFDVWWNLHNLEVVTPPT